MSSRSRLRSTRLSQIPSATAFARHRVRRRCMATAIANTANRNYQMSVLQEVRRQRAVRRIVRREGRAGAAAGAPLRDPDLHGRPTRPGQVRRAERGRRARHPQRRRPRQRRRHPLARHLVQAARDTRSGSSSTTPTAAWSSSPTSVMRDLLAQQPRDGRARRRTASTTSATGPGSTRGELHRLAHDRRPARRASSTTSTRIRSHPLVPGAHPDLRLHLRRQDRPPGRGRGRDRRRPGHVALSSGRGESTCSGRRPRVGVECRRRIHWAACSSNSMN